MMSCPGWMSGSMMLLPILFVIAILVGIVLLLWALQGGGRKRHERESPDPFEIVEERFARGEIDAQELEERRRALRG